MYVFKVSIEQTLANFLQIFNMFEIEEMNVYQDIEFKKNIQFLAINNQPGNTEQG